MTFAEYRKWGGVSRLSEAMICGSGPSEKTAETQTRLTDADIRLSEESAAAARADRARRDELSAPLIAKEKALASGDRSEALKAVMPTVSRISEGYQGAKDSIFNTLPPWARPAAMADLETKKATGIASAEAAEVAKAPEILANIGSGFGAFSLQELGAALSGYGQATSSNVASANLETAQSQAKWAPVIGLAQAAGGAAGGMLTGGASTAVKGSGSGFPSDYRW